MPKREKARSKIRREINVGLILIQIAYIISGIAFAYVLRYDLSDMSVNGLIDISIDALALPVTVIMYITCSRNRLFDRMNFTFMMMLAVNSFFIYIDAMFWMLDGKAEYRTLNIVINTFYFICPIVLVVLFWYVLCSMDVRSEKFERSWSKAINVLCTVAILLVIGNIFEEYYFTVTDSGKYMRNPDTYIASLLVPAAVLIICIVCIFRKKTTLWHKLTLITYPLLPFAVALITSKNVGLTFTPILSFASLFLIYSNLFASREREFAEKQKELAESKIQSLISQINPHFIYNTIGSASSLCVDDPDKAREMLASFSSYLRNNFSEMAQKTMIDFDREIDHLKSYIAIEKIRFPDIEVILDLKVTSFEIPSLSIQPLVENAITHGIMGRETGGTIKISSFEGESSYYVSIEDNGVGFDTLEPGDGRKHIGIANVRDRVKLLCGGELTINSTPGEGTTAIIIIPKNREGAIK